MMEIGRDQFGVVDIGPQGNGLQSRRIFGLMGLPCPILVPDVCHRTVVKRVPIDREFSKFLFKHGNQLHHDAPFTGNLQVVNVLSKNQY